MTPSPRAGRREWTGLAVLALPTLLLSLDMSVLYLALPSMSVDLGLSTAEQLWAMDVYGFMIAGFLVTMGTLGDRIGRRRLLLIGGAAFALASVVAAFSTSGAMLIATRALLGIAGATLMPSTLALISNMFADPGQRASAIAVWMSCFMGGMTVGPLVGGVLLEAFWWGAAFLMGVPVMLVLLVAGPLLLPEYRDGAAGRLDLVSVGLSLGAVLPVIYGLKEFAAHGGSGVALGALVAGVGLGWLFARRQLRLTDPLLDLRLFRRRALAGALGVNLGAGVIMAGTFLLLTLWMQLVSGLSPVEIGVILVPLQLAMACATMLAPRLARVVRPGLAAPVALGTDLVVGSVPPEKAGSAGALSETSGEFGIALGVAVMGSLAAAVFRAVLVVPPGTAPAVAERAGRGLTDGAAAAAAGPPELLAAVHRAFATGLTVTAAVGTLLFVGLAAVALATLRAVPRYGAPAEEARDVASAPECAPASA